MRMRMYLTVFMFVLTLQIKAVLNVSAAKFSKVTCEPIDRVHIHFRTCVIKAASRTVNKLSMYLELKEPVHNFSIDMTLKRRYNGWKPFLYAFRLDDGCGFLKKRNNPLGKLFFEMLAKYSNINHSCPFLDDFDIELPSTEITRVLEHLPVPSGDYLLETKWKAYNSLKSEVNIYAAITE